MKTANNPNYSGSINRPQPPAYNLKTQRGFSLIEVMISSLVGLVLLAGTMQMFSNTQQSSLTNTAVTRMQENGRAGLFFIENAIRLSGYRTDSLKGFRDIFPDTSPFFDFNGQVIKGIDNDTVNGNDILNGSDQISMRYAGNNDEFIYDCAGNTSPHLTHKRFEISFHVNNNGELICDPDLYIPNTTTSPDNQYNKQPLIDGVEDMQIFYGIDTNSDFTANYYVSADKIPNGSEVISVRVFLLLQSDPKIATQAQAYRWFDEKNKPRQFDGDEKDKFTGKKDERRLRKVFSSTIAVRNLIE